MRRSGQKLSNSLQGPSHLPSQRLFIVEAPVPGDPDAQSEGISRISLALTVVHLAVPP